MFYFLVYSSPATHPRISVQERQYIEKALNKKAKQKVITCLYSGCIVSVSFAFITIENANEFDAVHDLGFLKIRSCSGLGCRAWWLNG